MIYFLIVLIFLVLSIELLDEKSNQQNNCLVQMLSMQIVMNPMR